MSSIAKWRNLKYATENGLWQLHSYILSCLFHFLKTNNPFLKDGPLLNVTLWSNKSIVLKVENARLSVVFRFNALPEKNSFRLILLMNKNPTPLSGSKTGLILFMSKTLLHIVVLKMGSYYWWTNPYSTQWFSIKNWSLQLKFLRVVLIFIWIFICMYLKCVVRSPEQSFFGKFMGTLGGHRGHLHEVWKVYGDHMGS